MSLRIRDVNKEDWPAIFELAKKKDFQFPSLSSIFTMYVVESEAGEIVSFGCTVMQLESILVTNGNKKDTVESLKLLLDKAEPSAKRLGIDQIHAFVWNDSFTEILKSHFNFKTCKGEALYKDVK